MDINDALPLHQSCRIAEAEVAYAEAALAIRPDHAPTMVRLGIGLLAAGRAVETIPWPEKGLCLEPGLAAVWRWMLQRSGSLWYPMLRLFRQKTPGEWDSVLAEVADALRAKAGRKIDAAV